MIVSFVNYSKLAPLAARSAESLEAFKASTVKARYDRVDMAFATQIEARNDFL